jgi:Zn-dependent protease with chaperone function
MSVETAPAPLPVSDRSPAAGEPDLQQQIIGAFHGRIKPIETPLTYRIGILLVAAVMILLPLIYMAIIALVAYGVYYHAVNDVSMLSAGRGRGKLMVFVAYIAPMIMGPILVLFMFKPLLSRRPPGPKPQTLDPEQEPLVFAFVNRVCDAVGAPKPRQINVDCQVNASASFRRGLRSMAGNDLVLTIGLPIVAGMDTRQLAGVLAHEFGHFAQGAGMRLTYVIRSISHWLTRVVYERDDWDDRLVAWSQGIDIRFGWVLYLTRLFVWLTRRILWVLMVIGHGVSGYMLRQMEFDADRHEARLAGSDNFESTSRRIVALSIANQGAESDLNDFYREGRLGDDFPRLIVHNVNQFTPETYQKIGKLTDEAKTGWFDTHPCDRDRIASARREGAPGIFHVELPATALFRDFDDTSRGVTLTFYRNALGENLKTENVQSLDDLLARQQREQESFKALNRFFQGAYRIDRPLAVPSPEGVPIDQARSRINTARAATLERVAAYKQHGKEFDEQKEHERAPLEEQLKSFEQTVADRLNAALHLLNDSHLAAGIADAAERQADGVRCSTALQALNSKLPGIVGLNFENLKLESLLQQLSKSGNDEKIINATRTQMGTSFERLDALRKAFEEMKYPFDHARQEISVAEYLLEAVPERENPVAIYYGSNSLIGNFHRLRARLIGGLCALAERVEASLGLDPLPEPPKEETHDETPAESK